MIELTAKDMIQIATFIMLLGGVFWRFSTMLSNIQAELKLIDQKLSQMVPKLDDHETRIRALERKCLKHSED